MIKLLQIKADKATSDIIKVLQIKTLIKKIRETYNMKYIDCHILVSQLKKNEE